MRKVARFECKAFELDEIYVNGKRQTNHAVDVDSTNLCFLVGFNSDVGFVWLADQYLFIQTCEA